MSLSLDPWGAKGWEKEEAASQAPLHTVWGKAGITMYPGARFWFKSWLCHLQAV